MSQWAADQFTRCGCGHNLGQHKQWVKPVEKGQYPCRFDSTCGCQGFIPKTVTQRWTRLPNANIERACDTCGRKFPRMYQREDGLVSCGRDGTCR